MRSLCLTLFITAFVAGCGCDLGDHLSELAGDGAVDCGFVSLDESPAPAHACTVAAFREGRGFYLRIDVVNEDSEVERGIAGNAAGEVWFLNYDGGIDDDGFGAGGGTVSRATCLEPRVEQVPDDGFRGDRLTRGDELIGCEAGVDLRTVCD